MTDDPFDRATTAFIQPEDLVGRLVLFIPEEKGKAKGANGDYEYVTGDMLVIDGAATEKIPGPFPFEVRGQRISAGMMVIQAKPKIATKRPILGRVDKRPGQFNNPAYSFGDPTEADVATARPVAIAWLERREAEKDPFA